MTPDLFYLKLVESDISSESLKRVFDMALFERDPEKNIENIDLQAIRKLHDLIGLMAQLEIDFESQIEGLSQ